MEDDKRLAPHQPPLSRRKEVISFAVAAIVAVVFLVLFLSFGGGFGTAPTVSSGGESPATEAPHGQEPAAVDVPGNLPNANPN
jgi:nitrate reductase NapE component